MSDTKPTLLWLRRDLRLGDHPALLAALARGGPVIPVFICDESVEGLGAAPKWRLGLSLRALSEALERKGSRLILRRGSASEALETLIAETGAGTVIWSRLYDPASIARDTGIKTRLKELGVAAESVNGHLLFEPWTVETQQGGYYRVYTPMWNAVKNREVPAPEAAPMFVAAPVELAGKRRSGKLAPGCRDAPGGGGRPPVGNAPAKPAPRTGWPGSPARGSTITARRATWWRSMAPRACRNTSPWGRFRPAPAGTPG